MKRTNPNRWPAGIILITLLLSFLPWRSEAVFTHHFDALLSDLQARSATLTNATRLERRQKSAVDQSIRILNKNTNSLLKDITAGGQVARLLKRNFTNEFSADAKVSSFETLLNDAFNGLESDVDASLANLSSLIGGLPDGRAKTRAQSLFNSATNKLAGIQGSADFSAWSRLLTAGLRSALNGINIASKASGGTGLHATIGIGGTNLNFVADTFGAEWVQSAGILDIGGSRNGVGALSIPILSGFSGATGIYPLSGAGSFIDSTTFTIYIIDSGTLNITSFSGANHSLAATFSFTATNSSGPGTVTVSNGGATLNNVTVTP